LPPQDSTLHPVVGAMAIVVREGKVLLIRRRNSPDAARWSFPAGKVNYGEQVQEAAVRELREETGVQASAVKVITAVDAIDFDENQNIKHHFVIIVVSCAWFSGIPNASDDALDARWFSLSDLSQLELAKSFDVVSIARSAVGASDSLPPLL
jgi:8-oxo-dGTP diphosphatase